MLRLITDFDGPIMDVSERYYRVYQLCIEKTRYPGQTIIELSKSEFWQLKRSHTPEIQIALKSGLDAQQGQQFSQIRKQTVHTLPYFQYDVIIPTVLETLTKVQAAGIDLAVMTMRRVRELEYAFNQYNLSQFFPENRRYCLSNDYVKTRDVEDKPLLMARALAELPPATDTWMVGDTEADITAAKKHDVKIIAVESGIRDRSQLASYQPDMIVTDLKTAVDFILNQ
ncbi:HAD family hydrolase [Dolichospermum sp. ST_con]|nr:HAD family hydrolase [Dolichospermum sp. ST_con]MDD1421457.1 HAD family hydrolase [Dolichospermum sp. ST_sed1]MDD1426910.1 HAD family hydrolase [Dolichospermum sp. ST_sed9]MDD1432162.1 HAD family hydrolase [Dolichospermum sp. ST_sed6]MDD1437709.1 HAD family hydrolase [Dolichospermum sp. ST_sed10]MDD1442002.1 HAD family hydrolase [Dolichospermum sp. ST_sed3]MDD1447275.1 HAD family hydrolase [Dolichospermum sp. ST_sed8]MDD1457017.1 HAD family hydrolase [Dolichospermum sp. ST_sed7]MDD146014